MKRRPGCTTIMFLVEKNDGLFDFYHVMTHKNRSSEDAKEALLNTGKFKSADHHDTFIDVAYYHGGLWMDSLA